MFVGSSCSVGSRRSISSALLCRCSSGVRAAVLLSSVLVSRGGSPLSGVGSSSPVGSAVSRSQPQRHETKSASPTVAERKTKLITTNHNCARREPGSVWSRPARPRKGSQLACARSKVSSRSTRPSRPTSFRAHNHQLKRATGVRDTSSNAGRRARVLSFVPAGEAPWRSPGRVSSYRTSLSAALSLPSRATEAPPVRKRAALSDLLGYRTSFAREGQHPKVSATRK